MTPRAPGFRLDYMRVLFAAVVLVAVYYLATGKPGAAAYVLLAIGAPVIGWLVRNPYASFACGLAWGGAVLTGYWFLWF